MAFGGGYGCFIIRNCIHNLDILKIFYSEFNICPFTFGGIRLLIYLFDLVTLFMYSKRYFSNRKLKKCHVFFVKSNILREICIKIKQFIN